MPLPQLDMQNRHAWNRRQFLSLKGLSASTGGALAALVPDLPVTTPSDHDIQSNICVARRAMACEFSVLLPPDCSRPIDAASAALDEIERQEERLSAYRDTSLISYINQNAHEAPVHVDQQLCDLLVRASDFTGETAGAFDITAGALIKAWGFFRGPKRLPSEPEIREALARTGMKHVRIDPDARTVEYDRPGIEINLGSIGKGYALDVAAPILQADFKVDSFLIQGGKSSLLGIGSPAPDPRGWPIAVGSPTEPGRSVAIIRLKDRALGTTSSANQFFIYEGVRHGHVLDPRTGRPASAIAGVSVMARDAATADALATAFYILGFTPAIEYCQNHPDVATLLVPWPGDPEHPEPLAVNFTRQQLEWYPSETSKQHTLRGTYV